MGREGGRSDRRERAVTLCVYMAEKYCTILFLVFSSGSSLVAASRFSARCDAFDVPGIAQVTAEWETMNLRKNWAQLFISYSFAQGGSGFPFTTSKRLPSSNGLLINTAIPLSFASGNNSFSASRVAIL